MNELLAYWLVPAEPHRGWFSEQIGRLAAHLGSATFLPHLTVYAGAGAGIDSPASLLMEAGRELGPWKLRALRVSHSDQFTKTLFVEFEPSAAIAALGDRLRESSSQPSKYELRPHLSLAYQHLPSDTREALARSIALPFEEVEFDEVHAVVCPARTQTAKEVRAWRTVHRQPLGKA